MHVPPRPGLHSKLQRHWQGLFIVVKCPKVIPTTSSRPMIFANGSYDTVTSFASFAYAQYACGLAKTTAASRVPYKLQIPCILFYVHLTTARCRTLPTQMFSPTSRVDIPSREAESYAGQTHRQDRRRLHYSESVFAPSLTLCRGILSRRPLDRNGEWEMNPAFDNDDNVVISLVH